MYGRKEPPIVKGGQGRSNEEIWDMGVALVWFAAAVAAITGAALLISWAVH